MNKKNTDYNNQIILQDCLIGLKNVSSNSADIILVDPPYNIGKDFGNNKDNMSLKNYLLWCKKWIKECKRILKPNGTCYIYGFSEILAHLSCLIDLDKQHWLIWYYTNKTSPNLKFWQRSHESIICFWKENPRFNTDDVRVPYTKNYLKNSAGKKRTSSFGRFNRNENYESYYSINPNGALPKDVIEISTLAGGKGARERYFFCKTCDIFCEPKLRQKHKKCEIIIHPTQKPIELTKKLILASRPARTNYNVLIPFCGSGSECYVAKNMQANFLSFEINEEYYKLANHLLNITNKI